VLRIPETLLLSEQTVNDVYTTEVIEGLDLSVTNAMAVMIIRLQYTQDAQWAPYISTCQMHPTVSDVVRFSSFQHPYTNFLDATRTSCTSKYVASHVCAASQSNGTEYVQSYLGVAWTALPDVSPRGFFHTGAVCVGSVHGMVALLQSEAWRHCDGCYGSRRRYAEHGLAGEGAFELPSTVKFICG